MRTHPVFDDCVLALGQRHHSPRHHRAAARADTEDDSLSRVP